jgi:hypothetical protein
MTAAVLGLRTDAELDELDALMDGEEWFADMPMDAQARALVLLDGAMARTAGPWADSH